MNRRFAFLADIFLLLLLIGLGAIVYQHHYDLQDWWALRNYTPPADVSHLADQAQLTTQGRNLFYRNNPQIDTERMALTRDCHIQSDKTIELGCYLSTNKIYLLDIEQPQLSGEMVVTAAHETLHAAYDRLSDSQKRTLNAQLEAAAKNIQSPKLAQRLSDYEQLEPGERDNELHSILGTEFGNLPPELEAYFGHFFKDRSAIVTYSDNFNRTFDGLHDQIVQLDGTIKSIKDVMNADLRVGKINAYNSQVPVVNADITQYNQKVDQYNQYASVLLGQESVQPAQ